MVVKYKEYIEKMLIEHAVEFDRFKNIHNLFTKDRITHRILFNEEGAVIVDIVRDYEKRLCGGVERGNKAQYSSRLAEKFWTVIRTMFPLIDFVGCE